MNNVKALAVTLMAAMIVTGCGGSGQTNKKNYASPDGHGVLAGEPVSLGEHTEIVAEIDTMIADMYNNGAYFMLHVSEDTADDIMFIYNSDKNCYAETPDGCPIYYDELGNSRVFTSPYQDMQDLSPLMLVENSIQMLKYGKAHINVKDISLEEMYGDMVKDVQTSMDLGTAETVSVNNLEEESSSSEEENSSVEEESSSLVEESSEEEESGSEESVESSKETSESIEDGESEASEESTSTDESLAETRSAEEEVEAYLGWSLDEVKGKTYQQIEIALHGRDNIYELYQITLGDDAVAFVDGLFEGDENKEDDHLIFSIHPGSDYMEAGAMLWVQNSDDSTSIAWWFEGYIPLGGDWESLKDNWFEPDRSEEEVKEEMTKLVSSLGDKLKNFVENNLEDELPEDIIVYETTAAEESSGEVESSEQTNEGETSAVEFSSDEEIVPGDPVAEIDAIERNGSFKTITDNLLKQDGLMGINMTALVPPEGFTEADRDKMIELHDMLMSWDAGQQDGTLVSPLSPDEVDFATSYISACEAEYSKNAANNGDSVDALGTIFWKDTVGVFLEAIKR